MDVQLVQEVIIEMLREHVRIPMQRIGYLYNENTRDFEEFVIPQNGDNVEL